MKTLCFVRHGQSLANAGGVTVDHDIIPLTELGHRQAALLSNLLPDKPSAVYSSPFLRARDTAAPYLARTRKSAIILDEMREFETIDPLLLKGMTGVERRPIADAFWARANALERMGERAETFVEFDQRVVHFMQQTLPSLPDGAILFGHGMWIARLFWKFLGFSQNDDLDMKAFRRFQLGLPMYNGVLWRLRCADAKEAHFVADEIVLRQMVLD